MPGPRSADPYHAAAHRVKGSPSGTTSTVCPRFKIRLATPRNLKSSRELSRMKHGIPASCRPNLAMRLARFSPLLVLIVGLSGMTQWAMQLSSCCQKSSQKSVDRMPAILDRIFGGPGTLRQTGPLGGCQSSVTLRVGDRAMRAVGAQCRVVFRATAFGNRLKNCRNKP